MEKWQIALNDSPFWLFKTFIIVAIITSLIIVLVAKTRFGQQFNLLTKPCLTRQNKWIILLALSIMLILLLTEIRLNVLNTFFYNGLYSSLQKTDFTAFWFFALINAAIVGLRTLNDVFNEFLDRSLAIKWSTTLNNILLEKWLQQKNYYRLQMQQQFPDNIDQRIQQDAQDFINSSIEFIRGMVNSAVSTIEFTIVLWGLSGILSLMGFDIPKGIVFFVFIFVLLSTVITMAIGRPLIGYNFDNERYNGDYRYALIQIRDHSESIAFYNGEAQEQHNLLSRFQKIITNRWKITYQSIYLNGFNSLLTQGVQLLPLMLQAPRFFAGKITIGDMHQTVQAFNRLQRSLSFFRNFYESFTAYQARLERLSGFINSLSSNKSNNQIKRKTADLLRLHNLSLFHPNGHLLIDQLNLQSQLGDSILIQGPSGSGKTSLLRTIAGLWTFTAMGEITCPAQDQILFIPQRPYLSQGTLRQGICYPNIDTHHPQLEQSLKDCQLDFLINQLDQEDDWLHKLSPGELQRIAFVRLLLSQAKILLLDEATSALDEMSEAHLYRLLKERLSHTLIISVGHRSTLRQFHTHELILKKE